jgi:hypothetical protein
VQNHERVEPGCKRTRTLQTPASWARTFSGVLVERCGIRAPGAAPLSRIQTFSANAVKRPISAPWQASKSHTYFGTRFRAPGCHTFCRNAASGCESGSKAQKSAAEFERFATTVAGRDRRSVSRGRDASVASGENQSKLPGLRLAAAAAGCRSRAT